MSAPFGSEQSEEEDLIKLDSVDKLKPQKTHISAYPYLDLLAEKNKLIKS